MTYHDRKILRPPIDKYPIWIILIRWILAAAELGLALYFVFKFKFDLGIIFTTYSIVAAFVLLPLIRCVRCYYYGKRCNFGWGIMVARLFPRVEGETQAAKYGFAILFWPLRLAPIGLGLLSYLGIFDDGFSLKPHGLFLIYILVLILHRWFYRFVSCSRCHQRTECPVYDYGIMKRNIGRD